MFCGARSMRPNNSPVFANDAQRESARLRPRTNRNAQRTSRQRTPASTQQMPIVRGDCPICIEPNNATNSIALNCGHGFHRECIQRWRSNNHNTCPTCRRVINGNRPYQPETGGKRIRKTYKHKRTERKSKTRRIIRHRK